MTSGNRPVIQVDRLVKQYPAVLAVDGISFSIAGGEFFGFLGPNGAGKSTTMKILSTLTRKTSGEVLVAGYDVDREPQAVRRSIGFAADSYLSWQVATAIMMTVSVTAVGSGLALVMDISNGYFDKLLLAPINQPAILLSRLLTEATRVTIQMTIILLLAIALGVRPEAGSLGVLMILVMGILWAIAYASISITIALRTKNAEATQASFMLMFPLVFLTTAMMPKELYPGWLEVVVSINPVTYVMDGVRSLVIYGFDWSTIGWGFLASGAVGTVTLTAAGVSFQRAVK